MSKEKVEEPFVKMYELKGLKANEASFICKVWSFQTNGKRCFLSNPAWAEYLGCSPETVKRIKRRLRNNGYIETDGVFVRLIFDINVLIDLLKKNYKPKYKSKERIPNWEKNEVIKAGQNDPKPDQTIQSMVQVEPEVVQISLEQGLIDHQLDKTEDKNIKNIEESNITNYVRWKLSSFELIKVTSTYQIDLTSNNVTKRNQLLSLWYNYISTEQIEEVSIILFNDENNFNLVYRILCRVEDGAIHLNYMLGVNINHFLPFVHFIYEDVLSSIPSGDTLNLRLVADNIQEIIFGDKENFKNFINPASHKK